MAINPFSLENKTIVVAGASSGIGLSIARAIVQCGGKVIGLARREEKLREMVAELGETNASFIKADLTKDGDIQHAVSLLPDIDGYVHAAGILSYHPLKFIKREVLDEVMNANYYSAVLTLSELVKRKKIKRNQYASIVLISSISNQVGSKSLLAYSSSKGAMSAAARVIASELAVQKIRVNTLEPAMVKTDIATQATEVLSEEAVEKDAAAYPFGYGLPEDVAHCTVFLLSGASKWITAQTLTLDGGWRTIV